MHHILKRPLDPGAWETRTSEGKLLPLYFWDVFTRLWQTPGRWSVSHRWTSWLCTHTHIFCGWSFNSEMVCGVWWLVQWLWDSGSQDESELDKKNIYFRVVTFRGRHKIFFRTLTPSLHMLKPSHHIPNHNSFIKLLSNIHSLLQSTLCTFLLYTRPTPFPTNSRPLLYTIQSHWNIFCVQMFALFDIKIISVIHLY